MSAAAGYFAQLSHGRGQWHLRVRRQGPPEVNFCNGEGVPVPLRRLRRGLFVGQARSCDLIRRQSRLDRGAALTSA